MSRAYIITCIIANSLTAFFGILLAIAALTIKLNIDYLHESWRLIYILSFISIFTGVFAILVPIGFIYFLKQRQGYLVICFAVALVLIIAVATICSILLLIYLVELPTETLNKTAIMFNQYSDSNNTLNSNKIVQKLQQSFQCCGVQTPTDWKNKIANGKSTPDSCCHIITPNCGINALITKNDIYLNGCTLYIYKYLQEIYLILIVLNIGIAITGLTGGSIGFFIRLSTEDRYQKI